MKILCVSDTTSSLAFSSSVKTIFPEVDLVISAGDMPVKSYDYLSTMLRTDVCYVYGNHNLENYARDMTFNGAPGQIIESAFAPCYGRLLDGKCLRDKASGLLLAGLGGSMCYNKGESQFTERQMKWRILKLYPHLLYNKLRYGRYLDILVTHAPARGMGDDEDLCHRGFQCFLPFLEKFKPKYLLHGHIHLIDMNAPRVREYCDTKIINVYGVYLLDDEGLGEKR